jgi:spore maturation protein CgeB/GT2 family glycosyltransferase
MTRRAVAETSGALVPEPSSARGASDPQTQRRAGRGQASPLPVGMVGTFDVANYGDLLFPEIAAHELSARLGAVDLRRYSYRAMSAPPWCYPVRPVDTLADELGELALLVVGGGHLVRFDKAVAPGYTPTTGATHHPTGYWLVPTLLAASAGVPVAWNGVGASTQTPAWAGELLGATLRCTDYVSVRDPVSLEELHGAAPDVRARLVPDPAFGVRSLLDGLGAEWSAAVRKRWGLDAPYVIVQPSTRLGAVGDTIRSAVEAARAAGRTIVELPISPALGDRPGLLGELGGTVIAPWPSPVEIAALIGGAEAVVAHSLHLTITALVHGVPVMRATATTGTKYEQLAGFAGVQLFTAELGNLPELLATSRRGDPAPDVVERAGQLQVHWDAIADLVASRDGSSERRTAAPAALGRLLEALPTMVEGAAGATGRYLEAQLQTAVRERDEHQQRADAAESAARKAGDRLDAAQKRIQDLEAAAISAQRRADAAHRLLREELALRDARLIEADTRIKQLERDFKRSTAAHARATRDLERFRARRSVKAAVGIAGTLRQVRSLVRAPARPGDEADPTGETGSANEPERRPREATEEQSRELAARIQAVSPGSPRRDGPLVSLIVLTRDGRTHLERLLPALESTTYRSFELILVDNGSTDDTSAFVESVPRSYPMTTLTNHDNRSFSEACNQGAAAASGDLLLLLNNDIEPIGPGWLGRMVTTLEEHDAAAVGARLIYPRRPGLKNAGDLTYPDLTLQHRGIGFVPADGVPSARNLGTGDDPLSAAAAGTRLAAGVTAACMLITRRAWDEVGGLTEGFVYGTEDVDLCLKLKAAGRRIVYDGGAALWHHEYGTQNAEGAEWKRANRRRNRQLFADRWGPQLFRQVLLDRLKDEGAWSEEPLHVGITVTRDDTAAGWGDLYTARELGDALAQLGWRVSYLERHGDRWYDPDPSIDVVVALLDAIDIRRLPRHMIRIAWIRNWTHRWLSHPWFDDYDLVFASSETSRRLVDERSSHRAQLMPLATNPERFQPGQPDPALATDVVFIGNHWGQHRGVLDTLPELPEGTTLKIFGKGWQDTPLATFHQGAIPYESLPQAYGSARVVIDDTASPTKPYGAVNARVFDALATGAVVVSDNEEGIRELFDDRFPIARDGEELSTIVARLLAHPDDAARLAARYRKVVLERHTYEHRAAQFRDALVEWATARRVSILIGAPKQDEALAWGDYHFARGIQRQLAARGTPTRVEILPDWERASTARQDVVLHLFGLREYRARPSQVNLLWVISHPDLVREASCERYDTVLVASDRFADHLAGQLRVPVIPLHQATDPTRFYPDTSGPHHTLLYVANSRKSRRKIIEDLDDRRDLSIFGRNWTPDLVDQALVKGEYIPNEMLHRYYAAADIVLNDHWADMRDNGFIANRIYDALASGAFVISDDVEGIAEEFDDGVVTYQSPEQLTTLIERYMADPDARRAIAERGRAAVLGRHTFAHRTDVIAEIIGPLVEAQPAGVGDLDRSQQWLTRRSTHGSAPARTGA